MLLLLALTSCNSTVCPRTTVKSAGECVPAVYDAPETESVRFDSGTGDFQLQGTLLLPVSTHYDRLPPGVVLVHGSGPNTRDELSTGQLLMQFGKEVRMFEELAQNLVDQGFAVLRYDKRTCYHSQQGCENDYPTPDADSISYWHFRDDADAAVSYLAGRGDIDPLDVVVMGHSQGGQIVPFVQHEAATDIVLLAGPYRPVDQLLEYQAAKTVDVLTVLGYNDADIDVSTADLDDWVLQLGQIRAGNHDGASFGNTPASFWTEWLDAGDQTPDAVTSWPHGVLVLNGDYDWNVPPTEATMFDLQLAAHPDAEVQILPELTHPFLRVSQPQWQQITEADIGDGVDASLTDALIPWLRRAPIE